MPPRNTAQATLTADANPPRVRIRALCKTYPGASAPALSSIDLEIPEGSCFGLLGPNGAGKTTLVSILCGIQKPDSGSICLRDAADRWIEAGIRAEGLASLVGLVPQALAFYPTLTVRENLHYFGRLQGLSGARLRDGVQASIDIGRLQNYAGQRSETLSGGLQRRLNLAIGVIHAPPLLVLDEPTVGVDAQSRRFLLEELERIKSAGTTILYTSHYLDEVEQLCDRLAVIDRGRLVAHGSRDELLKGDMVVLRTAVTPATVLVQELAALPTVSALRGEGTLLSLVSTDPARCLADCLRIAQERGMTLVEASIGRRSLEALFFQLTGEHLRDGTELGTSR